MKLVPVGDKFAMVDDEDFERVSALKWYIKNTAGNGRRPTTVYAITAYRVAMHRFIMNPPPRVPVDHINGNGLDCRRENMRVCTKGQNEHNRGLQRNNTTGFKGVTKDITKPIKQYIGQVKLHGRAYRTRYCKTAEEAHALVCALRARLHGEFTRHT